MMNKDMIVLDHASLLKTCEVDGERIQMLSKSVDKMLHEMYRRRHALKRVSKVKKIFNIRY